MKFNVMLNYCNMYFVICPYFLGLLFLWEKTGAQMLKSINPLGFYIVYFRILNKHYFESFVYTNRTVAV